MRYKFVILVIFLFSCKKHLDVDTDPKKLIPSKVADLQALLDNDQLISQRSPKAMDLCAGEYFLTDEDWGTLEEDEQQMYTWEKTQLFSKDNNDWNNAYQNINTANTVLFYADKVEGTPEELNNVKGQALCLRALAFQQVAFIWTTIYSEHTADTDLGIPLKLTPDLDEKIYRATLKQTYAQIQDDLKLAVTLLPVQPIHAIRHSKPGAYALLARCNMAMGDYKNMGRYADLCLHIDSTLIDYNTLDTNPAIQFPFAPRFSNEEIITASSIIAAKALNFQIAKINPELYSLFSDNDLRKKILFRNNNNGMFGFRGNYSGNIFPFSGIATNEVILMRAEYYAREGNTYAAMEDLNRLLEKRFAVNTFVKLTAHNPHEALDLVLRERRKELILRGLRWIDLKRLNKGGANITLKRELHGHTYTLPPNDLRYALPIPEEEIRAYGLEQNPL